MDLSTSELRERVLSWGRREENVRAVLETGAWARESGTPGGLGQADELSDLDLELYAHDATILAASDAWLREIAPLWVVLPLENGEGQPPTRLAIYEGGAKIDFSLCELSRLGIDNSSVHERGVRVMLDKDGLAGRIGSHATVRAPVPSRREFEACAREFWFESHYVGKYLRRGAWWVALHSDRVMKGLLLRMLEWHAVVVGGQSDVWFGGRFLDSWAEPGARFELGLCFARGDVEDGWRALFQSLHLFRRLSLEVGEQLGFSYPHELDREMSGLLRSWRAQSEGISRNFPGWRTPKEGEEPT